MKRRMSRILALTLAVLCTACSGRQTETEYRDSTVISAETENAGYCKGRNYRIRGGRGPYE